MNFKIVEQKNHSYDDFKRVYMDMENYPTIKSVRDVFDMSMEQYYNWGNDVAKETGFKRVYNRGAWKSWKNNTLRGLLLNGTDIDEFKKDYLDGMIFKDLGEKYGISVTTARKLVKEHGLPSRRKPYNYNPFDAKNYTYKHNRYVVQKTINNKQVYFGSFATETEAQNCVEWLNNHNWSKKSLLKYINDGGVFV